MTRARALKQVIRARVAKTGERYTTARRHVLTTLERTKPAHPPAVEAPPAAPVAVAKPRSKGMSDEAFRKRTGHGLDHWFAILDKFGGVAKGHTASARHLYDEHGVDGWYAQGITVAYERARGVRDANQRCDGAYEVSVSKVLNGTTAAVIKCLSDPKLRRRWTGDVDAQLAAALASSLDGAGAKGVVVRDDGLGRHRYKWDSTTVQLYITPKPGGKVSVVATQMKLANAAAVETSRAQWRTMLNALAGALPNTK
jgi:hypothetical protein